jgi:hypothetical protein
MEHSGPDHVASNVTASCLPSPYLKLFHARCPPFIAMAAVVLCELWCLLLPPCSPPIPSWLYLEGTLLLLVVLEARFYSEADACADAASPRTKASMSCRPKCASPSVLLRSQVFLPAAIAMSGLPLISDRRMGVAVSTSLMLGGGCWQTRFKSLLVLPRAVACMSSSMVVGLLALVVLVLLAAAATTHLLLAVEATCRRRRAYLSVLEPCMLPPSLSVPTAACC